MNDFEIAQLLRSDAPIVLIEAPAGCGKTHQAASYLADMASILEVGHVLVLTHTHAACSVIAKRSHEYRNKIEIRTLDSLTHQIASAYRLSLGLPEDVSLWARENGYEVLASKVADLLKANPLIVRHLAKLFPIAVCDEHQDSNDAQQKIVKLLQSQGSLLRIFGDPMQIIPGGRGQNDVAERALARWTALKDESEYGELESPHRWQNTNPELGEWILCARENLKNGEAIDLTSGLPRGTQVLFAENVSAAYGNYQLQPEDWSRLNNILNQNKDMLLLAGNNATIKSLRGTFRPRFPVWEGHTRNHLEKFIDSVIQNENDLTTTAPAFIDCLQSLLVGFTSNKFGNRLLREIEEPTNNPRGDVPPRLKEMATLIRLEPNHIGFSGAAILLRDLINQHATGFANIHIDYPREFGDLINLGNYTELLSGLAEISRRRSRSYPKPPRKALSTVHKSRGLEAETVVVFACDDDHFPDALVKRNLLYVGLSRATESLILVTSRSRQSHILQI